MAKQRRVDFEQLRTQVVWRRRLLEMPGDIVNALSYSMRRCFGHPKDRPNFAGKSASNFSQKSTTSSTRTKRKVSTIHHPDSFRWPSWQACSKDNWHDWEFQNNNGSWRLETDLHSDKTQTGFVRRVVMWSRKLEEKCHHLRVFIGQPCKFWPHLGHELAYFWTRMTWMTSASAHCFLRKREPGWPRPSRVQRYNNRRSFDKMLCWRQVDIDFTWNVVTSWSAALLRGLLRSLHVTNTPRLCEQRHQTTPLRSGNRTLQASHLLAGVCLI